MPSPKYPFVTGGVTGWNLVESAYNDEHAYEVLQSTEGDQWFDYQLFAIRVDGEFLDDRGQGREGFKRLVERAYAMNNVWHRKQRQKEELRRQEAQLAEAKKNPSWGQF